MTTPDDYLNDAAECIKKARELIKGGEWQRGIFELGAATARIFQAVECFCKPRHES